VGLLKRVHARWACLFLDFRFYLPKKTIEAQERVDKLGAPSYLMKYLGLLSPNIHSHTERIGAIICVFSAIILPEKVWVFTVSTL
jgi:hypothetical protein